MKGTIKTKELWLELINPHPSEVKIRQLVKEGAYIKGPFLIELLNLIYPSTTNSSIIPARIELNIVGLLIELGADINYLQEGITPLHKACETYNPELVELLLRVGANPNNTSSNKQSILAWAKSLLNMERTIYKRGLEVLLERIIEVLQNAGAKECSSHL